MTRMSDDKLLPAALALPTKERAKLAREILRSLHGADEQDVEAAWLAEIDRRAQDVEDGSAEFVDWDVARSQIAQRLKARG